MAKILGLAKEREAQEARLDLVERHLAALGDSLAYPAYIVNRVSSVFHKV